MSDILCQYLPTSNIISTPTDTYRQVGVGTILRPDAEQTKEPAQKFSLKQKFQVVVNKQLQSFKKMKIKEIFGAIN